MLSKKERRFERKRNTHDEEFSTSRDSSFINFIVTVTVVQYRYFKLVNRTIQTTCAESINITDKCVERLKNIASAGDNLRIIVEGGGCVGFQYKFELDDKINDDDKVFEKDNVKIVIDTTSLNFINGSTVDYEEQLIRSSFKITNNPKATVGCSCGASFSVKID